MTDYCFKYVVVVKTTSSVPTAYLDSQARQEYPCADFTTRCKTQWSFPPHHAMLKSHVRRVKSRSISGGYVFLRSIPWNRLYHYSYSVSRHRQGNFIVLQRCQKRLSPSGTRKNTWIQHLRGILYDCFIAKFYLGVELRAMSRAATGIRQTSWVKFVLSRLPLFVCVCLPLWSIFCWSCTCSLLESRQ